MCDVWMLENWNLIFNDTFQTNDPSKRYVNWNSISVVENEINKE